MQPETLRVCYNRVVQKEVFSFFVRVKNFALRTSVQEQHVQLISNAPRVQLQCWIIHQTLPLFLVWQQKLTIENYSFSNHRSFLLLSQQYYYSWLTLTMCATLYVSMTAGKLWRIHRTISSDILRIIYWSAIGKKRYQLYISTGFAIKNHGVTA